MILQNKIYTIATNVFMTTKFMNFLRINILLINSKFLLILCNQIFTEKECQEEKRKKTYQ